MPDNGIKFFARGGVKLDDALEDADRGRLGERWDAPDRCRRRPGHAVRRARSRSTSTTCVGTLDRPLGRAPGRARLRQRRGLRGRAAALRAAGAEVVAINAEPDGLNINDGCGSTHLGRAAGGRARARRRRRHRPRRRRRPLPGRRRDGRDVDGDQLLAILALDLHEPGRLADDTVVATVMSNLGFVQAMRGGRASRVAQTAVGDRYVLEAMRAGGFALGGEQSGHVIMSEHATTGDGILTALHVLQRMAATGTALADARLGGDPAAAGAGQRARRRQGPRRRPGAGRGRGRRARPSSATPGGCCCARPAPSRWSG